MTEHGSFDRLRTADEAKSCRPRALRDVEAKNMRRITSSNRPRRSLRHPITPRPKAAPPIPKGSQI